MSSNHSVYNCLSKIENYFTDGVVDIHINEPKKLVINFFDKIVCPKQFIKDDNLTLDWINSFILACANYSKQNTAKKSILSLVLPEKHLRIEIGKPPISNIPIITLRVTNKKYYTLKQLNKQNRLGGHYNTIKKAIVDKKNIVIYGSTGSGKTTILNSFIGLVPENERLISIEDTPDIDFRNQKDHVKMFFTRIEENLWSVSPKELFKSCLRHAPDRIFVGELRGAEAFEYMTCLNSGHPGSITTFHSSKNYNKPNISSKVYARLRLADMYAENKLAHHLTKNEILEVIDSLVDIYIFTENAKIVELIN